MPSRPTGASAGSGARGAGPHLRAHRLLRRRAYTALAAHLRSCGRAELLARERRHAGGSAVHVAAALAPSAVLRAVLRAARVSDPTALDIRDGESGWTALHCAMHAGRVSAALALLAAGAARAPTDPDARTPADLYALRWAPRADRPANARCEAWAWGSNAAHQVGGPSRGRSGAARAVARAVKAATGHRHSLYVHADGALSAVGGGARGALGLGDERPRAALEVVAALADVRVVDVAASAARSAAVDEHGALYVWGAPHDAEPVLLPRKVGRGGIRAVKIVQVALEDRFWIARDSAGGLWGMGTNLRGELAMDETKEVVDIPKKITALADKAVDFVFVASGAPGRAVCGAITKVEKALFVWGGEFGRRPRRVRFEKLGPLFGGREPNEVVIGAAAGDGFLVIVTERGRLYGLRPSSAPPVAFRIWKLMKRQPRFVSACANRFVVGDEFGEWWTMNWELGAERPKGLVKVDGLRGISSVSLGKMHAVCIVRARTGIVDIGAFIEKESRPFSHPPSISVASTERTDSLSPSSSPCLSLPVSPLVESNECSVSMCSDDDEPPPLTMLCEDIILESLSLSNVSEMLLFAAEMHIPRLRDFCLAFVRNNFDILISLHGILDHLTKALGACEPDALDAMLRGTGVVDEEHDAAHAAGFNVWEEDGDENTAEVPLSALLHGICETCAEADTQNPDADKEVLDRTGLSPFSLTASAASRKLRALRKKLQSIQRIAAKVDAGDSIDEAAKAKLMKKCCVERELGRLEKYVAVELFAPSPTSSPSTLPVRTTDDASIQAAPFDLAEEDAIPSALATPASFPPTRRNLNAAFMANAANAANAACASQAAQANSRSTPVRASAPPRPAPARAEVFARPPPAVTIATALVQAGHHASPGTPSTPGPGSAPRKARGRARKVFTLGAMPSAASSPVTPAPSAPAGGTTCPWGAPASGTFSSRTPLALRSPPPPRAHTAFSAIVAEQALEAERERAVPAPAGAPAHMRAGRRAIPVAVPVPGAQAAPQSWNWPWQGASNSPPGSSSPSLRDIQREEEHNARGRRQFAQSVPAFAAVPVGASPPRGWNRLPGDHMPMYKSLPEIEAEERAQRARGRGNR